MSLACFVERGLTVSRGTPGTGSNALPPPGSNNTADPGGDNTADPGGNNTADPGGNKLTNSNTGRGRPSIGLLVGAGVSSARPILWKRH